MTKRLNAKDTYITFKALFDSGASCTLASEDTVRHLKKTRNAVTTFNTASGKFSTNQKYCVNIKLAEFNPTAEITHTVHVAKELGNYDIIVGQDLLHELGINIRFSTKTIFWNDVKVDTKKPMCIKKTCSTWKKNCLFQTKQIALLKY